MIEDIRDWVMTTGGDTSLRLMWHGLEQLEFSDGVHYYRMLEDDWRVSIARIKGFERWGISTTYYMMQLPYSKEGLARLVMLCQHLTDNLVIPDDESLGPLDIGPVYEIDGTGLTRLEILDKVGRYLHTEIKGWVTKKEVVLKDIESLVDIVINRSQRSARPAGGDSNVHRID